ncbi:MAG: hypothetical protein ACO3DQ_03245 [Cephaloticoccus sp.]
MPKKPAKVGPVVPNGPKPKSSTRRRGTKTKPARYPDLDHTFRPHDGVVEETPGVLHGAVDQGAQTAWFRPRRRQACQA